MWTSDQSTVTWALWNSGEPDGHTNRDCAVMNRQVKDVADKKRWSSRLCQLAEQNVQVVCEKTRKYSIYYETKLTN